VKEWKAKLKSLLPASGIVQEETPEPIATTLHQEIRVAEANIGRIYWEHYFNALDKYEKADKRTRRPAQDPLNALINYGYGMLYGEVESAVLTAGLDPHIGVLHREEDPEYVEGPISLLLCLMRLSRFGPGWIGWWRNWRLRER
jgi:CRISPR-associated endonuclease Cas1